MTLADDVAATLQPGFAGTTVPAWLENALSGGVVSVCLYGDNVARDGGLAPVCEVLRTLRPGVLLAVDEEGGDVTRVHCPEGSPHVGNAVLGRLDDEELTRASAAAIAGELATLGIGLDLGPVVDVNSSPENPVIGVRSFGADAGLVARHGAAWVDGLQSGGVAACAKHFPGHGDTVLDSHHALPRVDAPAEVLRERELRPFAEAVRSGVASVMTAHVVVSALDPHRPATLSPVVVRLLREGLGFDGVVVSDALDMAGASAETGVPEAAVRSLAAGVDLLCLGPATTAARWVEVHAAVVDAVESGRLGEEQVGLAAARVRALAGRFAPAAGRATRAPAGRGPAAADVARAFTVRDAVRAFVADPAELAVVQVESSVNLAVGGVAWGPAALGVAVGESDLPADAKVAVVGRALGPQHPGRDVARRLRAAGHRVVLVECGWPRGGADVATYGGSPAVARALLALLRGEVAF
jgi:beta-N-acetylhexosaminidase